MGYFETALEFMEELQRDETRLLQVPITQQHSPAVDPESPAKKANYAKEVPPDEAEGALGAYPSDPTELLTYLRARGFPPVIDETVGGRLVIDARSLPPPDLYLVVRRYRAELRALLEAENAQGVGP